METIIILDLVCRCAIGKVLPNNCIQMIMDRAKESRGCRKKRRKQKKNELHTEYNERGARVKRVKSKVRIKRAMRLHIH